MKKILHLITIVFIGINAYADSAPSLNLWPTTAITTNSATLNYQVGSNGRATTVYLKYGIAYNSGGNVAISTHNSLFFGDASYTISGLIPNTTYFITMNAVNNLGSSEVNATFTTSNGLSNTDNLIGKYRFSPSAQMVDESGNNNTLVASGSQPLQTLDRLGVANSATLFNSFYKLENTSDQFKPSSITISAWIKKDNSQFAWSTIAGYRYNEQSAPYNSYSLNTGTASLNKLSFNFTTAATNDLNITSNAILGPNVWFHVVATYNAANGNAKLYINGVLDSSATFTPASLIYLATPPANNNRFCLGAVNYINTTGFSGTIDEVFIYGRAITAAEVTGLYNSTYLSIQDFKVQNLEASICPNPTSNNFTVEIKNDVKSIEIYSLQGQKVLTTTNKNVNVSNLSKGIYLVRIEDVDNAIATQKLIVE